MNDLRKIKMTMTKSETTSLMITFLYLMIPLEKNHIYHRL